MSPLPDHAETAALDAFLNAALREDALPGARLSEGRLTLPMPQGKELVIPVRARSEFRCRFGPGVVLSDGKGPQTLPVDRVLARLCQSFDIVFADRVGDSLAALRRAPAETCPAEEWNFQAAEQALKFGHPVHPNPRSRDEMNETDARLYAPEFGAQFPLCWLGVLRDALCFSPNAQARLRILAKADGAPAPRNGHVAVPIHPWQAGRPAVVDAVRSTGAVVLGSGTGRWTATASMRALHSWTAPAMLKCSLNLRLTNSVRVLKYHEILRGVEISGILDGPPGAEIRSAFPALHILRESDFAALRGPTGPIPETFVALRDNPFRNPTRPGPVMMASLCEVSAQGVSHLGAMIARLGHLSGRHWFRRFLDVAIWPVLELRARWGLLFGAHQQNMMIGLDNGWPAAVWLRDCQGTGHLDSFHAALSPWLGAPEVSAGNVVSADLGDDLLTYYVVVNNVMNTLAALVLDGLSAEAELIGEWHAFLVAARSATPGERVIYDKLIDSETLACKGNFDTSRRGINEADGDADGQLATFLALPNPVQTLIRQEAPA